MKKWITLINNCVSYKCHLSTKQNCLEFKFEMNISINCFQFIQEYSHIYEYR